MNPPAPARDEPGRIKVWDPLVRIGHWTLAASVLAAWLTKEANRDLHEAAGYVALFVIAVRLVWGFVGPRYARFAQFVRAPAETLRYGREVLRRVEPRHIGHNPLGGWMVVVLLLGVALAALSGVLYTTDAYWGIEWVEHLHDALATAVLALAALHVAGVIAASLRHREDLVGAMVHGRKRAPAPRDVP
jgi:cytochrome b